MSTFTIADEWSVRGRASRIKHMLKNIKFYLETGPTILKLSEFSVTVENTQRHFLEGRTEVVAAGQCPVGHMKFDEARLEDAAFGLIR